MKLKNTVSNTLSHTFQKPVSVEIKLTLFLVVQNCSYGSGSRLKLSYTRKIIDAIHSGSLLNAEYKKTEIFGLQIPTAVDGVPSEILDPENTVSVLQLLSFSIFQFFNHYHCFAVFKALWMIGNFVWFQWSDKQAYKETLVKLAKLFKNNFETFTDYQIGENKNLTEEILAAGPIVDGA